MVERSGLGTICLTVLVVLAGAPMLPGRSSAAGGQEKTTKSVDVTLHDVELLDQDGRRVRFETEVIGDRIVVIDTFYTTCGLICPILSAIFSDLQRSLGDRLGGEVALVSISVDPNTDIPPRLKEYAEQWGARPGWVFLTGREQSVTRVLEGLGLYAADFTAHPAAFLVGDGTSGEWTRFFGFPSPEKLLGRVEELAQARR